MSRVARSARVASRQRTEAITAAKTLTQAESGEYYLINYNTGAEIVITLPSAQEGSYFKFLLIADLAANAAKITWTAQAGEYLNGGAIGVCADGADPGVQVNANGSSHVSYSLDGNTDVHKGTWLEFVSDGSEWYISGLVLLVDGGTCAASITAA